MTQGEVADTLKSILIQSCKVKANDFSWDKPLEVLQDDFKTLHYLIFLEQLLNQEFNKKISLLENISASFHTPNDIVQIILNEM